MVGAWLMVVPLRQQYEYITDITIIWNTGVEVE